MYITLSEFFRSIQGEGKTLGIPSLFVRLSGCNLLCGGSRSLKTKELSDGATWRCDSIESWTSGTKLKVEELAFMIKETAQNSDHLILTGGEPLLWAEQLIALIKLLKENYFNNYIEIETNGTLQIHDELLSLLDQINVSPKLANSGMSLTKRAKLVFLKKLPKHKTFYKFVVSSEADVQEAFSTYIQPLELSKEQIYLMPAASSRRELQEILPTVAELAKGFGYNLSTRLHLTIWDKATGV